MKNIFLAPRSGEQVAEHFKKTIRNGYKKQDLMPYLKEESKQALNGESIVYIWGNRPGGKGSWGKMQEKDYIFFYQHGKITWIGQLKHKTHNKKLADALWGPYVSKRVKESWEYVYFLDNLVEVDMDYSILRELAGYKPNAIVQGFQSYRENGIKAILDRYGSIEKFINMHRVGKQGGTDIKEGVNGKERLSEVSSKIKQIHDYISSRGFKYNLQDIANLYLSLKTKPFVLLAGISGTGKTGLARLFAEAVGAIEENGRFKLIPVHPDWNDNSDLVGYTGIDKEFVAGQMIGIMTRAKNDQDKPHFVCLDEMNLARVEHYFSDFLSIIESRRWKDNNHSEIITDSFFGENSLSGVKNRDDFIGLQIPDNLYLMGSVNMDETTHPFSRKVLDRANTLEFNEVFLGFEEKSKDLNLKPVEVSNNFLKTEALVLKDLYSRESKFFNEIIQKLREINKILELGGFQVAYRVRDEVCFYMWYDRRDIDNTLLDEDQAFDVQISQKILPRIQGSGQAVENVLVKLFEFCTGKIGGDRVQKPDIIIERYERNEISGKYKRSAKKIAFMLRRLKNEDFTSFWI